ncbi:hypothetical protein G4B88_019125 [Cannabis sativa]|uniref:Uncharacterized protein n=1 Tax=Cannabis sativa TaxID=3483 RepID=A0A7J6HMU2_CANSA|nr:hypothetical protein G4B88_019125 [Cannabis sativa]
MDIEGDENKSIINVEAIDNGSESIISIFEISSDSVAETQSQPLLEISDDNTSTSHPADHTDKLDFTIDVSGSSNKKLLEEHDDGSDKIEYLTPHIMSSSTPSLSLSSSSSTSSSSSDLPIDLSQVDTNEEEAAGIEISIIEDDDDDDDEVSISSEGGGSSKSERQGMSPLILELMTPQANSSSDDVMIHESNVHGMSSPKIQTMERFGGGYDPKRIPSSVFEISKTTTPMEWSAASNESLFSIHVGNSSFSRDNLFAYNDSVAKSGELTKSGDELVMFSPCTVSVPTVGLNRKSFEVENEFAGSAVVQNDGGGGMKEKTTKDTIKPPPPTTTADDTPSTTNKAPTAPLSSNSSSHSHQSDGSAASVRSFAFPVKTRSVHGDRATFPIVVGRSATLDGQGANVHGKAATVQIVAGRSAMCFFLNVLLPGSMKSESARPDNEQLHPDSLGGGLNTSNSALKRWCPCFSWCSCRPAWCCSWPTYCCSTCCGS